MMEEQALSHKGSWLFLTSWLQVSNRRTDGQNLIRKLNSYKRLVSENDVLLDTSEDNIIFFFFITVNVNKLTCISRLISCGM